MRLCLAVGPGTAGARAHLPPKTRAFREFSGILRRHSGRYGAIAQLGERLHGMQEVDGSIPSGSTIKIKDLR